VVDPGGFHHHLNLVWEPGHKGLKAQGLIEKNGQLPALVGQKVSGVESGVAHIDPDIKEGEP